ncbi:MAG: hypothetical protein RRY34_11050, partial [Victivallaceae bacterium]
LAKTLQEANSSLGSFYVLEYARKLFGDKKFDAAYEKFRQSLNHEYTMEEAEKLTADDLKQRFANLAAHDPGYQAYMEFAEKYTQEFQNSASYPKISEALKKVEAHQSIQNSFTAKAFSAHWWLKNGKNPNLAQQYYLALYFDTPHYYDGEYAEFRIKELDRKYAAQRLQAVLAINNQDQLKVIKLYRNQDPRIFDRYLKKMQSKPSERDLPQILACLESTDYYLQCSALNLLITHPEIMPDKLSTIKKLASGNNVTLQAISAILAVKMLPSSEYLPILKQLNANPAVLVQIDLRQAIELLPEAEQKLFNLPVNPIEPASSPNQ